MQTLFDLTCVNTGRRVACVERLSGFWECGRGIIGRAPGEPGTGYWLTGVASIHTFFVSYPIDVIFLSSDFKLVGWRTNVRPWTPFVHAAGATETFEMTAGSLLPNTAELTHNTQWKISALCQ